MLHHTMLVFYKYTLSLHHPHLNFTPFQNVPPSPPTLYKAEIITIFQSGSVAFTPRNSK